MHIYENEQNQRDLSAYNEELTLIDIDQCQIIDDSEMMFLIDEKGCDYEIE